MRVLLLAALVSSLAFAGCSSSDSSDSDGASDDSGAGAWGVPLLPDGSPAPLSLDYTDCSEQIGIFPTPPEMLAGSLPAGFAPVPFDDADLTWTVLSVAFSCIFSGAPVAEFGGGLAVTPPEEFRDANITEYAIALGWVTDRPEVAAVYDAWGANGTHFLGEVSVAQQAPDNPALRVGMVRGSSGPSTVTMETVVPGTGAPEQASTARIFLLDWETMNVTSAIDFSWTDSTFGSESGAGVLGFEGALVGLLPAVQPGLAFHYWGDYGYRLEYVPL